MNGGETAVKAANFEILHRSGSIREELVLRNRTNFGGKHGNFSMCKTGSGRFR